ncbi:MAG TPA: protein kinase [Kofleriaceae bacterium]|nr:protein kinase [Kofleriaceae bacterium]
MTQDVARVGDYRIERELGNDATGVIYEATHLVLPRRAALKVCHDRSCAVQLMREACVLEALAHPGVPRVYECGVLPDKRPWVARELVDGISIGERLGRGSMALSDIVVMVRTISEILAHAHARGVVHDRLGNTAVIVTPQRPFPYCVRGWTSVVVQDSERGADPSADVHALGVLAYRALIGELPERPSAQENATAAPLELTALIDQMLADDPRWRPTATEVRDRAAWLAQTLELVPDARPRWTPPHGLGERASTQAEPELDVVVRIRS